MQEIINHIKTLYPSQKEAAAMLEYSERQWLNIRKKVAKGEELSPRAELWLHSKYQTLRKAKQA